MEGKRVTKAELLTLDEALRSVFTGWLEVWPTDGESYLVVAKLCFGGIVSVTGLRLDLERVPGLYNRKPGVRIWAGPPPTDAERAAAPWEVQKRQR